MINVFLKLPIRLSGGANKATTVFAVIFAIFCFGAFTSFITSSKFITSHAGRFEQSSLGFRYFLHWGHPNIAAIIYNDCVIDIYSIGMALLALLLLVLTLSDNLEITSTQIIVRPCSFHGLQAKPTVVREVKSFASVELKAPRDPRTKMSTLIFKSKNSKDLRILLSRFEQTLGEYLSPDEFAHELSQLLNLPLRKKDA